MPFPNYPEDAARFNDWIKTADAQSKDDLLYHLLMKRHVDGLNGRTWDASEHLDRERIIAAYLGEKMPMPTAAQRHADESAEAKTKTFP